MPLTIFLSFISVQFPARGLPSDILILLWCSRQCRLYLPSVEVCYRGSNGSNMRLSSTMYRQKSLWKCHHYICIWQIVEKLSSTHLRLILKQARHAKFVQPIACSPRQFWPTLLVHHAPWRSKYFFLIPLFWKDVQDVIKWKRTLVQKKYVDSIFLHLFCVSSLFYLQTLKCF